MGKHPLFDLFAPETSIASLEPNAVTQQEQHDCQRHVGHQRKVRWNVDENNCIEQGNFLGNLDRQQC